MTVLYDPKRARRLMIAILASWTLIFGILAIGYALAWIEKHRGKRR